MLWCDNDNSCHSRDISNGHKCSPSWGHGTILKKAWELDHLKSWECFFFPWWIFWSITYVKLKSMSHSFRFPQSLQKVKAYSNGSKIKLWNTLQSPFKIIFWHTRIDSNWGQEGLPWWLSQQKTCLQCRRPGFDPWVWKSTCQVTAEPGLALSLWQSPQHS